MNALAIHDVAGGLVADSRDLAAGLDIQHHNFLGTVQTHLDAVQKDFGIVLFQTEQSKPGAGRPERFAYLSEDQALFVATLSRNSAEVVQFKAQLVKAFAAARKALQQPLPVPDLSDALVMATMLQDATARFIEAETARREAVARNQHLELAVADLELKGAFYDAVTDSKSAIEMAAVAKVLAFPGIGRTKLFAKLRAKKVLRADNSPYQEFIRRDYFRLVEQPWKTPDGQTRISLKTLVLQKGLDFIRQLLAADQVNSQQLPGGANPQQQKTG